VSAFGQEVVNILGEYHDIQEEAKVVTEKWKMLMHNWKPGEGIIAAYDGIDPVEIEVMLAHEGTDDSPQAVISYFNGRGKEIVRVDRLASPTLRMAAEAMKRHKEAEELK
jgi:hypothetical protein